MLEPSVILESHVIACIRESLEPGMNMQDPWLQRQVLRLVHYH